MNTPTWSSPIDLPDSVRLNMIPLLNQHLADAIDLGLQAKQAHWNVKGPQFVSLHGLFDEVAEILEELTDELAERVVELVASRKAPSKWWPAHPDSFHTTGPCSRVWNT